jgi:signal transduction histidine kinase
MLNEVITPRATPFSPRHSTTFDGSAPLSPSQADIDRGVFVHELRNLTNTAILAWESLKISHVDVAGGGGAVLTRTLLGLRSLIKTSLDEARPTHQRHDRERFRVCDFIDEAAASAQLEAHARGVDLVVPAVDERVRIDADRQALSAVVSNLLQNAFKFTRAATTVVLRVSTADERVLIEIEDACGGLSATCTHDLFGPFVQQHADRSGLGLGLAFSRRAVEANGGRLSVRNIDCLGCVFTVDLPVARLSAAEEGLHEECAFDLMSTTTSTPVANGVAHV